jgi:hypothetical protein
MQLTNVTIVQSIFAALGKGNLAQAATYFDPEIIGGIHL